MNQTTALERAAYAPWRLPVTAMRVGASISLLLLLVAPLGAQGRDQRASIDGRVIDASGAPVAGALVRATLAAQTLDARTDSLGAYSIQNISSGAWVLVVRRLGFIPDSATVVVGSGATRHDVRLRRAIVTLDERVVLANWTGVRGVVGTRDFLPLADAIVTVVGRNVVERTNDNGQFALPWRPNQSLLLRVQANEHTARLVSVRIPESGSIDLSILLDSTTRGAGATALMADELDRRMRWSSATMSAYVAREEILAADTRDLRVALESTPSFNTKGLVIERDACVFVNGLPRPGFPLDAIDPATVEFIEVYPASGERSGSLASRWPRGGVCGAPIPPPFKRRVPSTQLARYVVVWTRQP